MPAFVKATALAVMMMMLVNAAPTPGPNSLVSSEKREAKQIYPVHTLVIDSSESIEAREAKEVYRAFSQVLNDNQSIKAREPKELYCPLSQNLDGSLDKRCVGSAPSVDNSVEKRQAKEVDPEPCCSCASDLELDASGCCKCV